MVAATCYDQWKNRAGASLWEAAASVPPAPPIKSFYAEMDLTASPVPDSFPAVNHVLNLLLTNALLTSAAVGF